MTKKGAPTQRGDAKRVAKRLSVREQVNQAGWDPVDGISEARKKTVDAIVQLEEYLQGDGGRPWFVSSGRSGTGEDYNPHREANSLLHKLYEYLLDIDKDMMPYCHPKQSAHTVMGEDGGPVVVEKIERVIVDPDPKRKPED